MIDIKELRKDPADVLKSLKKRGSREDIDAILVLDKEVRFIQTELQSFQKQRNDIAQEMVGAKTDIEKEVIKQKGEVIKGLIQKSEHTLRIEEQSLDDKLSRLPNILDVSVPIGKDETENALCRRVGTPKKFDFEPKEHHLIEISKHSMDFETASKVSGSRFVYLKGDLAKLHRALENFMIDTLVEEFGYTEIEPPYLTNTEAMFGTGQLPKSEQDMFRIQEGLWLIPTGEVPLTNYVAQKILKEKELPIRFCGGTPCFRAESGASGKDTHGMIRHHQFRKVEMVSIVKPDQSEKEHERMLGAAETILQKLELPYQVMLLCSGDTGFTARKTYDLEVWLPGQNKYREISSCSNCGDFQARRMKARYKTFDNKTEFVHTLNGSGLAVGRTLIAVLENYQQSDGSIIVPNILKDYMRGCEVLKTHL